MSKIARFAAYAATFDKAVETDDWSLLEPFFTEDAVYEVPLGPPLGGRFEGRAAVLRYEPGMVRAIEAYLSAHGPRLGIETEG